MRKTAIILALVFSGLTFAQKPSNNPFVYEEKQQVVDDEEAAKVTAPTAPGDAPINDYIPFLLVAAVGIAAYYTRKYKVAQ